MVKVISFSLWGNLEKYSWGMVENAKLAAELFPDWECWVYFTRHGAFGPSEAFLALEKMDNVKFIPLHMCYNGYATADWTGMFWRFDAINEPDVDVMISRDCDSRLSLREAEAVDEWLASDKGFHVLRDHSWHTSPIMGGMFGMKKDCIPGFEHLLGNWKQEDRWQTDQEFLAIQIWPRISGDVMIHDSFYRHVPKLSLGIARDFPTEREPGRFVGQAVEADGSVNQEHVDMLAGGPLL